MEIALRQAESERQTRTTKAQEYFTKGENWVAALTLAAVVIYTAITVALWWEQINANDINRRALANSEGASVYFGSVFHIADTVQPDGTTKATIRFKIGNSGASTTRALTYQTACTDSIESQGDPYDRNVLATNHIYRLALAPKSEIEPIACTLELSKVVQLAFQNPWIYIFGLASYRDTTSPDMWHHVEFCLMTHGFGGGTKGVTTLQYQCERHNCTDDECMMP